jgi:hypothetical protein
MKKKINVARVLIFFCLLYGASDILSQDITNTLSTGGIFTIKDGIKNYFTVNQSTGQVNILNTLRLASTLNSATGVIYINGFHFLHTYGSSNLFTGINAGNFSSTGRNNCGLGEGVFTSLTSGSYNSSVGFGSMSKNTTGNHNTSFGHGSLALNTTGNFNSACGYLTLRNNTTGSYNAAFGYNALVFNTTGNENSAFGKFALSSNTGGHWNTAFGESALQNATSSYNTAIGHISGSTLTTGSGNILIGFNSTPSSTGVNNQITLGNSSITSLRCAVTTITSLSDARDKKNIQELKPGLNFLLKIKPRLFNWDKREWYNGNTSDGSKMQEAPTAGFISQELDELQQTEDAEWLSLVFKDNPEKLEAVQGNLLPLIVKAIQELKNKNDALKNVNEELKAKNEKYKEILHHIKNKQVILKEQIGKMSSQNSANEMTITKEEKK